MKPKNPGKPKRNSWEFWKLYSKTCLGNSKECEKIIQSKVVDHLEFG